MERTYVHTRTLPFFRVNVLNAEEEASILASFLMSGFWHKNTRFQIRLPSKLSYNSLAFLFLGVATYFAKNSPSDPRLDQNSRLYNDSKSDHGNLLKGIDKKNIGNFKLHPLFT